MAQSRPLAALLLAPLLLVGCKAAAPPGPNATHEAVVASANASMRTTADVLNGVTEAAGAAPAIEAVKRETATLKQLGQRLKELSRASGAECGRVKKHAQEMIDASEAMKQAAATCYGKVQAGQFLHDVGIALTAAVHDYGQAMIDFADQAKPLFD